MDIYISSDFYLTVFILSVFAAAYTATVYTIGKAIGWIINKIID